MKTPSMPNGDPASKPRRDAFVTIERRVGAPRLFATAYSTVGSSIYFALGVVAASALGLTPLVLLGFATSFHPGSITNTIDVGKVPKWSDLIFGMTVAVIAYTGIEAAANLAPEVRVRRAALRRTVSAGAVAVVTVFVGMSVVAL